MKQLAGKIAVVTGASRGIGKGIALGLAAYGATVYVTGRTENDDSLPDFLKGTTIHKTAEGVNQTGGIGIAHHCDFSHDEDVKALFERVKKEQGKLDILVNNAFAAAKHAMKGYFSNTPFWKQPIALLDDLYTVGLRSSYLSSQYAAEMMAEQKNGLITNISFYAARQYWISPPIGMVKAAVDKITADTAHELKEFGIKVFSLYPGVVSTEGSMELAKYVKNTNEMESPQFVGMCVAALALDDNAIQQSGKVLLTAEVAQQYGFTDIDGKQPKVLYTELW